MAGNDDESPEGSRTNSMSSDGEDAATSKTQKEALGFFDTVINAMNTFELNATHNSLIDGVRNRIDAARLYLQTDTTGGDGKRKAQENLNKKSTTSKKGLDEFSTAITNRAMQNVKKITRFRMATVFIGSKLNQLGTSIAKSKLGEAADFIANTRAVKAVSKGAAAIGSGLKHFGKSTLGFGLTVGVQVANSGIKTGAVLFNATKLGIMAVGALAGSELCKKNLKAEALNLRKDLKSTVISYINTFAVATGLGAALGAKASLAYSVSQTTTGLADAIGKTMGLTAAQVEEAAVGKKLTAMTLELNKTEFYKKNASTMELRDPEMYKKLVNLRADHIDKPGVSIEEKRAAAVLEKEILETFRNNQNTMVGMAPRLAKSAYARVSKFSKEGTLALTQEEAEKAKTEQSSFTKGISTSLKERQEKGYKDIAEHTENFKEYLKIRKGFEEQKTDHNSLSASKKQEYLNLHRQFGKGSFSREM